MVAVLNIFDYHTNKLYTSFDQSPGCWLAGIGFCTHW